MQEQIDFSKDGIQGVPSTKIPKHLYIEIPEGLQTNIVVGSLLEKLLQNINNIPVDKLEEFINQYTV